MWALTQFMTRVTLVILAVAALWRPSAEYRLTVSLVVCAGALLLTVRSFVIGKFVWGAAFVAVLAVFTPFRTGHWSPALVTSLDLAALALVAASPFMLRKPRITRLAKVAEVVPWRLAGPQTSPHDRSS
jgi:hypothetical protein